MSFARRGHLEAKPCKEFVDDDVAAVSCDVVVHDIGHTLAMGLAANVSFTREHLSGSCGGVAYPFSFLSCGACRIVDLHPQEWETRQVVKAKVGGELLLCGFVVRRGMILVREGGVDGSNPVVSLLYFLCGRHSALWNVDKLIVFIWLDGVVGVWFAASHGVL